MATMTVLPHSESGMTRRGFLSAILALGVAPAIVRVSSLMPVRVPLPPEYSAWVFGNYEWTEVAGLLLNTKDALMAVHGAVSRSWTAPDGSSILLRSSWTG